MKLDGTLGLSPDEFEDPNEWEDAKERELGNLKTCAAYTRVGHRVPWLDNQGIETGSYDICMTPNQVRKLFGGKKGVKDAKRLGCGAFACAWQTGPDEVIKITADADDVTAIKLGQGLEHVVKMREAVELNKAGTDEDGEAYPVFAMRLEKLDPVPEELAQVIESLPVNVLAEEFTEHYGAEFVDPQGADANYGLSPSTRMHAHDVACSYTDMDEKPCHKFVDEFLDTVEALGQRGVNWYDIHDGNVGMKGPVWKALDIGMSGTKERPDVPLLKGLGRPAGAKIKGTFCERTARPRAHFDQRSFRWTEKNGNWILVGCPKGKWDARRKTCKVGTRAHKVLSKKAPGDRCRRGRRVKK